MNKPLKECKIHGLTEYSKKPHRCKKCAVIAVSKRRYKLKEQSISYKGGKCEKCGYNKCVAALEFHHKDPKTKELGIASRIVSWERLQKELDKCILVCSNCHREIHFNQESKNKIMGK